MNYGQASQGSLRPNELFVSGVFAQYKSQYLMYNNFNHYYLHSGCAEFFQEYIEITLHFLPFLNTKIGQMVKILPPGRYGPAYTA